MATRGVILLAMGSPLYGRLAFNCALTLKAQRPRTPVRLWWQGSALAELKPRHLDFFDERVELPQEFYRYGNQTQFFRVKTRLNELTPFEETLFLDADVAFFNNGLLRKWLDRDDLPDFAAQTFNLLSADTGEKLVPTEYGSGTWSTPQDMKKHWGWADGLEIPQINSSFMFWRRTEKNDQFWARVATLWDAPLPKRVAFNSSVGETIPDELLFHAAGAELGIRSPEVPFVPLYADHETPASAFPSIRSKYWGLMTYGQAVANHVAAMYNDAVNAAHGLFGRRLRGIAPFHHINKNDPRYRRK